MGVLVAWVLAGLTTYLSLDEFWVRFVGALAALVALAAGGVQVPGLVAPPALGSVTKLSNRLFAGINLWYHQ